MNFSVPRTRGVQILWCAVATITSVYLLLNSSSFAPVPPARKPSPIFTSKKEPVENGYVTSSYARDMPGRLGNHFFGLLALIGIADKLKRNPYIKVNGEKLHPKIWTLKQQFPRLYDQLDIVTSNVIEKVVPFANGDCCRYHKLEELQSYSKESYLHLQGAYFQSFKYFDYMRKHVREWLTPSERIQRKATTNLPIAYRNRFLICVHTRRTDFVTDGYHFPSERNFSVNALRYLFLKYDQPRVGAIILGDDRVWKKQTFNGMHNVYIPEHSTPEQDLALAKNYCDVVLLTAPSSTFGFFIGYTSKNFKVYYRDIRETRDKVQKEMNPEDFYPESWIKLRVQKGIIVETRKQR